MDGRPVMGRRMDSVTQKMSDGILDDIRSSEALRAQKERRVSMRVITPRPVSPSFANEPSLTDDGWMNSAGWMDD